MTDEVQGPSSGVDAEPRPVAMATLCLIGTSVAMETCLKPKSVLGEGFGQRKDGGDHLWPTSHSPGSRVPCSGPWRGGASPEPTPGSWWHPGLRAKPLSLLSGDRPTAPLGASVLGTTATAAELTSPLPVPRPPNRPHSPPPCDRALPAPGRDPAASASRLPPGAEGCAPHFSGTPAWAL